MNPLVNRLFSFAFVFAVAAGVIAQVSSHEGVSRAPSAATGDGLRSVAQSGPSRGPASLTASSSVVAGASSFMGANPFGTRKMKRLEVCRESSECEGDLLCLNGACTTPDPKNRGQVGDFCSGPAGGGIECLSGICGEGGTCQPSLKEKAQNGSPCTESSAFLCRSGVCRDGACAPSLASPGLPLANCILPSDCLSKRCVQDPRTKYTFCASGKAFAASCAPLGEPAVSPLECCSGSIDATGQCAPVADPECTLRGDCAGRVGRTCADVGWIVVSATQCCSGKMHAGRCVVDVNKPIQPCRLNRACRTGHCDQKLNLCTRPGLYNSKSPTRPVDSDR